MELPAILGGRPTILPGTGAFQWPIISAESEAVVIRQLHTALSIYDRSGVFAEFEESFREYHSRKYGLLSNSGTSSILAMFDAIDLQPGDLVLCPVYTFHATVSPLMQFGAAPIFCDCDDNGNISLREIQKRRSERCKAVIVTHMWGVPVKDIGGISEYCQREGLFLLEDCSHAHGAAFDGRKVGTFGDMAAWSLQGQKVITGGEGGILLTDERLLYERALIHGHYNKRPKTELRSDSPLSRFFLTGQGLKLRAHPLAIALALHEFRSLDRYLAQKQAFANQLIDAWHEFPFIRMSRQDRSRYSWYAFTFNYSQKEAFGVSRQEFVAALHAEGLSEFDIPGSTGLLHELPLFLEPNELLGRLYSEPLSAQCGFPNAEKFFSTLIKLPVWARAEDQSVIDAYIEGFRKVASYLMSRHGFCR